MDQAKLLASPAICFIFTPDKKLLYLGKADNLQQRWNNHHKYQYFIETSIDCRIGYFVLDSADNLDEIVEELGQELDTTPNENILVTSGQLNQVKQELYALKRQFDIIYGSLSQLGLEKIVKRLEDIKPPTGQQEWQPTAEDLREGITRGNLMKHFGFNSSSDLENAADFYSFDADKYLEELSGWQCKPIEKGSSRTRFFPPKK